MGPLSRVLCGAGEKTRASRKPRSRLSLPEWRSGPLAKEVVTGGECGIEASRGVEMC